MSYRNFTWVFLGILLLAVIAAPPQAMGQISLTDSGSVFSATTTYADVQNNFTVSPSADVLVVNVTFRQAVATATASGTAAIPTVTYNGVSLTPASFASGTVSNFVTAATYYLFNPPTNAADVLDVNFGNLNATAAANDYAIAAYSLGGVDTTVNPEQQAGWTPATNLDYGNTPRAYTISTTLNNLAPGAWASSTAINRYNNSSISYSASNGTLLTTGPVLPLTPAGTGDYWQVLNPTGTNTYGQNTIQVGAIDTNLVSPSETLTASTTATLRFSMATVAFAPKSAGTWTGATNGTWDFSTSNWTGGNYTDGTPVLFTDAGAANTNITIPATVHPGTVWFGNQATTYTFAGAGGIAGTADVVVSGSGGVTFNTSNSYSGGTTIGAGTFTASAEQRPGHGGGDHHRRLPAGEWFQHLQRRHEHQRRLRDGECEQCPRHRSCESHGRRAEPERPRRGAAERHRRLAQRRRSAATVTSISGSAPIVLGNAGSPSNLTIGNNTNNVYSGTISEVTGPGALTKSSANGPWPAAAIATPAPRPSPKGPWSRPSSEALALEPFAFPAATFSPAAWPPDSRPITTAPTSIILIILEIIP